jgi:hypothetical protein
MPVTHREDRIIAVRKFPVQHVAYMKSRNRKTFKPDALLLQDSAILSEMVWCRRAGVHLDLRFFEIPKVTQVKVEDSRLNNV